MTSTLESVIAENTRVPQTEDTRLMALLIGKPLTRIEIHRGGKISFEFDPFGAIVIEPRFGYDIHASTNPDAIQSANAVKPLTVPDH